MALQGKRAARTRTPGRPVGGFSNTVHDDAEKEFTIMMLSFQAVQQTHTQLLLQTRTNTSHTHSARQNQYVMNIVLHLNMKTPLWGHILWVLGMKCDHVSVLISLCVSAWCVCDCLSIHAMFWSIKHSLKKPMTDSWFVSERAGDVTCKTCLWWQF